mmetsp:Transcript_29291/g.44697  ORF Transcript_29291/g.44697 Transcript_29291/m.44697 type:complete len:435 (-) Transcript_29291:258-1562(-)
MTTTMVTSSSFYKEHCSLFPYLFLWFLFSIVLTMTNRYVFGILHFPSLLTATSIHFLGQFLFAYGYTTYVAISSTSNTQQQHHLFSSLSWRTYLELAIPVGVSSALDIGLSNMAMSLAPVSICTMVKAATPLFVVFLSFGMKLAQPTWRLCTVMVLITAGELLMVQHKKENQAADHTSGNNIMASFIEQMMILTNKNLSTMTTDDDSQHPLSCDFSSNKSTEKQMVFRGICFMLLSSFFSAVRWTFLQWKLPTLPETLRSSPIATLRIVTPSMFASLLPIAIFIEYRHYHLLGTCSSVALGLGFGSGLLLAIPLMLSEYALLIQSSAIVLMIGGVCKEICTILFGIVLFHEVVTGRAWLGFVVVTVGVCLYKVDKLLQKRRQEEEESSASGDNDMEGQQQQNSRNDNVGEGPAAPPTTVKNNNDLAAPLLAEND